MINSCEAELICDFAEVYHIYGLESVPVELAATLAAGLRCDSRTAFKLSALSGLNLPDSFELLAMIFDALNWLRWTKTKDAEHRRNVPRSVFEPNPDRNRKQIQSFRAGAEFRAAWNHVTSQNQ